MKDSIKKLTPYAGFIIMGFLILFVVTPLAIYNIQVVNPKRDKKRQHINQNYFRHFNESFTGVIIDINTP